MQLGQNLSLLLRIDSVLALDGEAPELLDSRELDVLLDPSLCPLRTLGPVRFIGLQFFPIILA